MNGEGAHRFWLRRDGSCPAVSREWDRPKCSCVRVERNCHSEASYHRNARNVHASWSAARLPERTRRNLTSFRLLHTELEINEVSIEHCCTHVKLPSTTQAEEASAREAHQALPLGNGGLSLLIIGFFLPLSVPPLLSSLSCCSASCSPSGLQVVSLAPVH